MSVAYEIAISDGQIRQNLVAMPRQCRGCGGENEGAHHRCGPCRAKQRRRRLYPACPRCRRNNPPRPGGRCDECLAEVGLRWCGTCERILVGGLDFYETMRRCKHCSKKLLARRR